MKKTPWGTPNDPNSEISRLIYLAEKEYPDGFPGWKLIVEELNKQFNNDRVTASAYARYREVTFPNNIKRRMKSNSLKGRKRPKEVIAKIRRANLGKKRTTEQRAALGKRVKEGYKQGKYRVTPEQIKYRIERAREANTGRIVPLEQRLRHSRLLKGRPADPEARKRAALKMKGRPQTKPLVKKGPTNKQAITAWFRSPFNVIYKAHCIAHFVRTNEHLFHPDDVQWSKPDKGGTCRAYKGLLRMTETSKHTRTTWKGWTRVSHTEAVLTQGRDLLDRTYLKN